MVNVRARGENDERCHGGGRASCWTAFGPSGACGGYVCRSDEDVYGHTAERELVAAVSDRRGGGPDVCVCDPAQGWLAYVGGWCHPQFQDAGGPACECDA